MMIELNNVSFQYAQGSSRGKIEQVDLKIQQGEVILICGESGCGKTTVTRLVNGLIPHYYEGTLDGSISVDKTIVNESSFYDLTGIVGSVFQNPRTQFFAVDTTSEIAFGCENLGMETAKISQRITKSVSELNIENLLERSLFALSGGEKQKIACASISAMEPEVFVLDEPSSNLDVAAIGDLKKVLMKWKAQGKTILIAEHRLYYLMDLADKVIYMKDGEIQEVMPIREFRAKPDDLLRQMGLRSLNPIDFSDKMTLPPSKKQLLLRDFYISYQKKRILDIKELMIPQGAVVGVIGNNGAGKTTFANCLCGLLKEKKGSLWMNGKMYRARQRLELCYLVMQDVNHQLFTESVHDEVLLSLKESDDKKAEKIAGQIMRDLNIEELKDLHPMSLSGGQKQRVAIAGAIASNKEIIVFDEPTSGLDYRHMKEVAMNIRNLSDMGKTQFIITHDPELIAECCNYFVFIENGYVLWCDGWNQLSRQRLKDFFAMF